MASSFSVTNEIVSFSADSSRTVLVMYGAALDLPQRLLQGHDQPKTRREIGMQMQVSFFRSFKFFFNEIPHKNERGVPIKHD